MSLPTPEPMPGDPTPPGAPAGTPPADAQGTDPDLEMARRQEALRERLGRLFSRWGYRRLRTPLWEEAGPGAASPLPEASLCRFVDPAGRVLALRPDHTLAVARWAAARYRGDRPWRLYYVDPVYRRDPRDGRFVAITQAGVELIGLPAPWGDVEAVGLLLDALDELGLAGARVVAGHTGLLRQLLDTAGLTGPAAREVAAALASRDRVALRRLLAGALPPAEAAQWFDLLTRSYGPAEAARQLARWPGEAAAQLAGVLDALDRFVRDERLRVEFGLARDLEYYTGLVFEVYAGSGRVAAGGRYDTLLERLGGRGPAVGFAFDLEGLAAAVPAAPEAPDIGYLVAGPGGAALWAEARRLRRRGESVIVAPGLAGEAEALAEARRQGCRRLLWLDGARRVLRMVAPVAVAGSPGEAAAPAGTGEGNPAPRQDEPAPAGGPSVAALTASAEPATPAATGEAHGARDDTASPALFPAGGAAPAGRDPAAAGGWPSIH